jgi:uncharacterized protein YijF (DUF1287 family)
MKVTNFIITNFLLFSFAACQTDVRSTGQQFELSHLNVQTSTSSPAQNLPREIKLMLESAMEQTKITKSYDPNYTVIAYPSGDVSPETGVCTDVIIRAMRRAKIDLQKEVHEDMQANFVAYPKKWGLKKADPNIDHRRVPNLQTFFSRKNKSLSITSDTADYKPGDIIAWDLDGKGLTHIGIVSNVWNEKTKRYSIIHNIGRGAEVDDVLFDWKIIGHYRYF